ncbi:hypothetical protein D9758_001711 [Tetrapyrgos nigripes]|uniref:Uncharacterized protein n=1 Tax=Tetrapyrgos nigripes TaxID=182062 RepID=A0A8H5LXB6_9AGAR|nr:hypothetical protein D9758_001711 [Tetrapyrgos nigripes]
MILDEKTAPPPYTPPPPTNYVLDADNPYASYLAQLSIPVYRPSFSTLPPHLLLQIVYSTFPQEDGKHEGDTKIVRQRDNLLWLETSLRLVCRKLYIACMHILRSTYLPTYDSLIQAPYSSDPFPSSEAFPINANSPYQSLFPSHRELVTLDKFIAVLAHEDVLLDSTSLHLTRSEAYKDIFDLLQPKSRLEDLVADEGAKCGVISLGANYSSRSGYSTPATPSTEYVEHDEKQEMGEDPYRIDPSQLPSSPSSTHSFTANTSAHANGSSAKSPSFFRFFNLGSKSKGKGKSKSTASPIRTISPLPPSPSLSSPSSTEAGVAITPVPFSSLTITFSPRKVALMYSPTPSSSSASLSQTVTGFSLHHSSPSFSYGGGGGGYGGSTYGSLSLSHGAMRHRKRALVEVEKRREETLEVCARRVVRALKDWLVENGGEV